LFAGTAKQYSTKAMLQLARMASYNGVDGYFSWPYQAKVINTLETTRRRMGVM
jgi:hypothetical protein